MTTVDLAWLEIERARHDNLLDTLTGLPKWALLIDRTEVALARVRRSGLLVAVFVLDDPQPFGRGAPDINGISAALKSKLRPGDTLARIGDRRFALVCGDIRVDEDAALIARRLITGAGVICNLGVALGGDQDTPESLIGRAMRAAIQKDP